MATQMDSAQFFIWGIDQSAYGPVELPTLISWIKDERVLAETWIFLARDVAWRRATEIPELQMFFRRKASGAAAPRRIPSRFASARENPGGFERRATGTPRAAHGIAARCPVVGHCEARRARRRH